MGIPCDETLGNYSKGLPGAFLHTLGQKQPLVVGYATPSHGGPRYEGRRALGKLGLFTLSRSAFVTRSSIDYGTMLLPQKCHGRSLTCPSG